VNTRFLLLTFTAVALALGGCPRAGDQPPPDLTAAIEAEMAAGADPGINEQEELRRRVAVWSQLDGDNDGLPNDLELEFGLDPDDPTDGPDIDGDGTPNFRDDDVDGDAITNDTDPDIDGDGLSNLIDADIDGDAVPDQIDFDMDADGIRNEWDWDDDSDGNDDGPDDNDDDFGALGDEDLRFSAAVQALTEKLAAAGEVADPELREKAQEQYRGDLRDLLAQVSKVKHESRPIRPDGKEVELISESLARRFHPDDNHKAIATDLKSTITQLLPIGREAPDATDAVDAIFNQVMEIENPRRPDANDELQSRLDALQTFKSRFRQTSVPACSAAVSALVKMPGSGTLQEKVQGVLVLADAVTQPGAPGSPAVDKLTELVSGLGTMAERLERDHDIEWGWDVMIDVLEGAPGIENGIGPEQLDYAEEEIVETEGGEQ
jgi:hypothetical protein